MSNPLLEAHQLPPFSRIKPADIQPALSQVLAENRTILNLLMAQEEPPTWDGFVVPLEDVEDHLSQFWSPISHLHSVKNSEELRETYHACLPAISAYCAQLSQNDILYKKFKALEQAPEFKKLSQAQRKFIENTCRDFELQGVSLSEENKKHYQQLEEKLSELTTVFSDHVLDATQAWSFTVEDEKLLTGLPEHVKILAKQKAEEKGQQGYFLTLDMPCYLPVMQYADNRDLRRKLHEAYVARASECSEHSQFDNSQVMLDILRTRLAIVTLLGFDNFSDYSVQTKMVENTEQVIEFLHALAERVKPHAIREMEALATFANNEFQIDCLEPWDIAYYSEKLRERQYDYSEEALRPYFPEDVVLSGMFSLVKRLYGVTIQEVKGMDAWHEDVRFFEIREHNETLRGYFYIDLYARSQKRDGAWMDECRHRRLIQDALQVPVAYLTCNFTPPIGDKPACFTHDEVITLFHEFGHTLHHVLTTIDVPGVAGIQGVAWDAVELPSQFMENWCWKKEVIAMISRHVESNEPLPDALFEKLVKAKNFQRSMQLARQLEFSLFDFYLHRDFKSTFTMADVSAVLARIRAEVTVVPVAEKNRFQHSFSHIFSGGYAAGYYSYLWAEVLSSDAFARFEEEGLFNQSVGHDFLYEILERGGSADMALLYEHFRGRPATIDAFLRHNGLSDVA